MSNFLHCLWAGDPKNEYLPLSGERKRKPRDRKSTAQRGGAGELSKPRSKSSGARLSILSDESQVLAQPSTHTLQVPKALWDKYAAVMLTFHDQFCLDVDFIRMQAENLAFDFLEQLQGRKLDFRKGPDCQFTETLIQPLLPHISTNPNGGDQVSRRKRVFVGEVSVDSGTVVIVDPCIANCVPNPEQSVEPYDGQMVN